MHVLYEDILINKKFFFFENIKTHISVRIRTYIHICAIHSYVRWTGHHIAYPYTHVRVEAGKIFCIRINIHFLSKIFLKRIIHSYMYVCMYEGTRPTYKLNKYVATRRGIIVTVSTSVYMSVYMCMTHTIILLY